MSERAWSATVFIVGESADPEYMRWQIAVSGYVSEVMEVAPTQSADLQVRMTSGNHSPSSSPPFPARSDEVAMGGRLDLVSTLAMG